MFEGFNREFYDSEIWTLTNPSTSVNGSVQFGGSNTGFRTGNALSLEGGTANAPTAKAVAKFPATQTAGVYVGFCRNNSGIYSHDGYDTKLFSALDADGDELCTIEIARVEPDPTSIDATKLTLLFKQSGTTVASFYIPNTICNIIGYSGTPSYKYAANAYLNDANFYFEFYFSALGYVSVRLNGADLLTPGNSNSASLSASNMRFWVFHANPSGVACRYDDFYVINDTPGTHPNTWLGYNTRVASPNANTYLTDSNTPDWENAGLPFYLHNNNGDASQMVTDVSDAAADYSFPITASNISVSYPTGWVFGGVRLAVVGRKEGANAQIKLRYRKSTQSTDVVAAEDMSDPIVLGSLYTRTWSQFFATRPGEVSELWTSDDFNDSGKGFGFQYL
ncbi:hypothetical protein EBZ39_07255 [bacterium]|nr:hypothetical protein [bacterium]